jgi:DnaK suppressor protein
MDEKQQEKIRDRLLEERQEQLEALAKFDDRYKERLEQGKDELSNYPLHMADDGTDTMEQEKEYLLASAEGRQLVEIDAALRMLYRNPDEFQRCESCGQEIGAERLELVPWTRFCIDCQEQAEARPAAEQGEELPE